MCVLGVVIEEELIIRKPRLQTRGTRKDMIHLGILPLRRQQHSLNHWVWIILG